MTRHFEFHMGLNFDDSYSKFEDKELSNQLKIMPIKNKLNSRGPQYDTIGRKCLHTRTNGFKDMPPVTPTTI